jgi:hypothetical protein
VPPRPSSALARSLSHTYYSEDRIGTSLGGAPWTYVGSRSASSTGEYDFTYSGTGTYSWTTDDGSGTSRTMSGTLDEDGGIHSDSNSSELWTADIDDGSWIVTSGARYNGGSTEHNFSYSGAGSYTVAIDETVSDSGGSTHSTRDGGGTLSESGDSHTASGQSTNSVLAPSGSWTNVLAHQFEDADYSTAWSSAGTISYTDDWDGGSEGRYVSGTITESSAYSDSVVSHREADYDYTAGSTSASGSGAGWDWTGSKTSGYGSTQGLRIDLSTQVLT